MKFIFFAASVFYKGSFNLFLLSPVGDPRSFLLFLPFCHQLFQSSLSVCFFSSFLVFPLPLFPPPCGSECFNNDALGIWDSRSVFSPPPFSFFLCFALIPPSSNMSGKRQTINEGRWEETNASLLVMVFNYTMTEINIFLQINF